MSRYVKADMIGCPCGYCEGYDECQKEVDEAPSIDIVRCGECKHWNEEDHWCNIRDSYGWDYKPDDFCSYGERKGEVSDDSRRRDFLHILVATRL